MQISQNLKLKQSQSLVMTPQLQQAIKLLQLTNLELCDLVNKELEENPFLNDSKFDEEIKKDEEKFDNITEKIDVDLQNPELMKEEISSSAYENSWDNDKSSNFTKSNSENLDPGSIAERTVAEEETLKSFLLKQAGIEFEKNNQKLIAKFLIDYIEPSGWLTEDLSDLCEIIGCELINLQKVLDRMKTFEPCGVFAKNLNECIKIQLRNKSLLNDKISLLVDNLELLASGNIKLLARRTELNNDEIVTIFSEIKKLNPKPGSYFNENVNINYDPDIIVKNKNGEWEVELNQSTLPKIIVNETYINQMERLKCGENDKKFISESIGSARWLIKAVEQRNLTTLKISSEIVKQQKLFFEKGVSFLKPMILKDVAKKIGMHESTVSRVTSSKIMLTPRGMFDMKHFFSASINSTTNGESHSAASVRETLKNLISQEPLNRPLSDEAIASQLQKEGINLARRTVAKYRELLNIPSSAERKKLMKIQNIGI